MIIDAREDVVTLSGCLDSNVWPAIQAPANLLLRQHPTGILIDASDLEMCTPAGVKTFLDAIAYIERYRARIVFCNVPDFVADVIRSVPGARSRVAIAADRESGRASLVLAQRQRDKNRVKWATETANRQILVPLIPAMPTTKEAIGLSKVLATTVDLDEEGNPSTSTDVKTASALVHLAFFVEVPRSLPLSAPLAEAEDHARRLLNEAESLSAKEGLRIRTHLIRTRSIGEEIVEQAGKLNVNTIVLSLPPVTDTDFENVRQITHQVLETARCEVVLKRIVPNQL
jgi:anti-anti-sigma regulatory factor